MVVQTLSALPLDRQLGADGATGSIGNWSRTHPPSFATAASAARFAMRSRSGNLLVAGFRLCRSVANVNDQLRTLDHRADVMNTALIAEN